MIEETDVPYVRMTDFRAQWKTIRSEALQAIEKVGESGWLILGREVASFEKKLAEIAGVGHAIGCANGLDAIEISLHALGIQSGERVITTPLTAFATTLAIIRAGGCPVFVDVDETGLIDLDAVERLLLSSGSPPRFLVPVHLFGHALDLNRLKEIKESSGLLVVEDCAQAILARSNDLTVGTVGEMSALSLYPTKNLGAMGDGGAILTNNRALAHRASCLRDYGQSAKYLHTRIGMNSRLDEIQAALLHYALLPRLEAATARRREIAAYYRRHLSSPGFVIPPIPKGSDSVYHLFPILIDGDRDSFRASLKEAGVETGIHYPMLISDQEAMVGEEFEIHGQLENARRYTRSEVSLPIHPYLTQKQLDRVTTACNAWPKK